MQIVRRPGPSDDVPTVHHERSELHDSPSNVASPAHDPLNEVGAYPVAHEIDHTQRRAGGGYSSLPEPVIGGNIPVQADRRSGQADPLLAEVSEEGRQLGEARERLDALERLDHKQREVQRRREELPGQLR
jgi:hypothetical protein